MMEKRVTQIAATTWHVLLIGNEERWEFRPVLQTLVSCANFSKIVLFRDRSIDSWRARPSSDVPIDLLFLLQEYPEQYSVKDISLFQRLFPLSPLVLIAGPLCEGEGRTGHVFPGTVRLYWHQWGETGRRNFFRFLQGQPNRFACPKTSIDVDHVLQEFSRTEPVSFFPGLFNFSPFADSVPFVGSASFGHSSSLDKKCGLSTQDRCPNDTPDSSSEQTETIGGTADLSGDLMLGLGAPVCLEKMESEKGSENLRKKDAVNDLSRELLGGARVGIVAEQDGAMREFLAELFLKNSGHVVFLRWQDVTFFANHPDFGSSFEPDESLNPKGGRNATKLSPSRRDFFRTPPDWLIFDALDLEDGTVQDTMDRVARLLPSCAVRILQFGPRPEETLRYEEHSNIKIVAKPFF